MGLAQIHLGLNVFANFLVTKFLWPDNIAEISLQVGLAQIHVRLDAFAVFFVTDFFVRDNIGKILLQVGLAQIYIDFCVFADFLVMHMHALIVLLLACDQWHLQKKL